MNRRQGSQAAVQLLRSYAEQLNRLGYSVEYKRRGSTVTIMCPPDKSTKGVEK